MPNLKLIEQRRVVRLVVSIRHGTVTASLIMRKLAASPRRNSMARALRELGRIEQRVAASLSLVIIHERQMIERRKHV